ncbi:MAG: protein kinase [Acidobacteriota bacterium]|jgi:tetratricopeptide (TPR) repeat protein
MVAGRFRIAGLLGRGGGGQIYSAHDLLLGRRIALKAIHPELAGRSGRFERLRSEVLAAREVTHPNVCRIYDLFRHRSRDAAGATVEIPVMAMELLEGETLAHRIRRDGPMAPEVAAPVARQLAAGLAAAHGAGVLHLDFKSSNIVLTPSSGGLRAVIADFGLARSISQVAAADSRGRGTPGYMAPEQRLGGPVSPATDTFALGCVLHEMLTGDLPVPGEPIRGTGRVPLPWRRILASCLAEDPAERPSDGAELAGALDTLPLAADRGFCSRTVARHLRLAWLILLLLSVGSAGPPTAEGPPRGPATGEDAIAPAARQRYLEGLRALQHLDPVAARRALEAVVEEEPAHVPARLALSEAWSALGRPKRARAEALRAAELAEDPDRPLRLRIEARSLEAQDRFADAAERYRSLHALEPDRLGHLVRLVNAQIASGQAEQAQRVLESYSTAVTDERDLGLLAILEARIARELYDAERQLDAARRAAALAERREQPGILAEARWLEGLALRTLGRGDQGLGALAEALEITTRLGDSRRRLDVLTWFASLHCEVRGEVDRCMEEYDAALTLARELEDSGAEARVLINSGADLLHQGRLNLAEERFHGAGALFRELGADADLAKIEGNLALVHLLRNDFRAAEAAFERALDLRRRVGPPQALATLLNNLGALYGRRGEHRRARDAWEESADLSERQSAPLMATLASMNLTKLSLLEGDVEAAERRLERDVEPRLDAIDTPSVTGQAALVRSEIALIRDREDEALAAANEALGVFEQIEHRGLAARARADVAGIHNRYGRFAEAEEMARAAIRDLAADEFRSAEIPGLYQLVHALASQGRLQEARQSARALAERIAFEDVEHSLLAGISSARVALAAGEGRLAITEIERALESVPPGYQVPLRLDAKLLVARAEAELGDRNHGAMLFRQVAVEAERAGFDLLARRASEELTS